MCTKYPAAEGISTPPAKAANPFRILKALA
jgi:hypothetical protein